MTVNRIGVFIKNTRHTFGISQGKLSEMVGVDVSLICRIEKGSRIPSRKTIKKLAKVLSVDQRELLILAGLPLRKGKVKRPDRHGTAADNRVGIYIKNMRESMGLAQSALAQAAGVSPTTISRVESFKRLPSRTAFSRILQALGTNEQEMMTLTGSYGSAGDDRKEVDTVLYGPIDPLAAMALRREPVETQRLVVDLVLSMKATAKTLTKQMKS